MTQTRPHIEAIRPVAVPVSDKTTWVMVEVRDSSGASGWGEATLFGHDNEIQDEVRRLAPLVLGRETDEDVAADLPRDDLRSRHVRSAIDQACLDLLGKARGQPLCRLLGGARRDAVPYYANINRGTLDRSPDGWAARAREAVTAGFDALKLAPFDGVDWNLRDCQAETQAAVRCVRAIRRAVGPDPRVMIDCHGRFTPTAVLALLDELKDLDVFWLEDPLPDPEDSPAELAAIRRSANARGIQLAGGEDLATAKDFARMVNAGCFDVLVPDLRALGGFDEALAVADLAARRGVRFAPHNPAGPIFDAASFHLALAAPELFLLEVQFEETPLFEVAVQGGLARRQGRLRQRNAAAGLGLAVRAHA